MKIIIDNAKTLADIKYEFNEFFPFLTLEFFENESSNRALILDHITVGKFRKLNQPETLTIFPEMSVTDLQVILLERFGLLAKILRKSGVVWLNTTHSNAWSLAQQNTQGEIVTQHLKKQDENNK